jgi:hypothetical protein
MYWLVFICGALALDEHADVRPLDQKSSRNISLRHFEVFGQSFKDLGELNLFGC